MEIGFNILTGNKEDDMPDKPFADFGSQNKPDYIRITNGHHGYTIKDGFKFGIGFWFASIVVSIILTLASLGIMGILATLAAVTFSGITV